jgi:hypothetical protein
MAKDPINTVLLRYTGLFDFDGLYAAITDWGKNYGYMWHEKMYKHKVPSPDGAEQEMTWIIDKNVTEFIKFDLLIDTHIWEMTEVEVEVNGKKKTLTKARMEIKIAGNVSYDWQGKFKGSKFKGKMLGWWRNVFFKKNFEAIYHDQLTYRVWNLHALMKKYFDMQTKKYNYKGYLGED